MEQLGQDQLEGRGVNLPNPRPSAKEALFVRTRDVIGHRNKQRPLTQISNQAEMG